MSRTGGVIVGLTTWTVFAGEACALAAPVPAGTAALSDLVTI